MTTLETIAGRRLRSRSHVPLVQPRLPRLAPVIVGAIAIALALLLVVLGMGLAGGAILGVIAYLVALPALVAVHRGPPWRHRPVR